jgi:uncharacterized protein with HEPN domain
LHHILDEAGFLSRVIETHGIEAIESDETLERAVVRSLEVIGEAARNIPNEYRIVHTYIPWRKIVGLRNRLIHEYFAVDFQILKGILRNEISELRDAVIRALGEFGAEQNKNGK